MGAYRGEIHEVEEVEPRGLALPLLLASDPRRLEQRAFERAMRSVL